MNDDRDQHNERFKQALDEMFGPQPSDPEPVVEPSPDPVPAIPDNEPQHVGPHPVSPGPSSPAPVGPSHAPPVERKRSWRRTFALGCAGAVGLMFVCLAALMVIGFVAGDDEEAATVDEPVEVVFTAEPSYTVEPASGTQVDLVPIGTYVELNADWRVAVLGVTPDATEMVLAENQFNEPPDDGRQFFMAMTSVENTSDEPEYFPGGVLFRVVNDAGREYTTFDDYCGVVPDSFSYEDIPAGEVVTGNFCWSVREEDADALMLHSTPFLDTFGEHYFSLQQ